MSKHSCFDNRLKILYCVSDLFSVVALCAKLLLMRRVLALLSPFFRAEFPRNKASLRPQK